LGSHRLRFGLIRAGTIERRRDRRGIGRILHGAIAAVPHADIEGETGDTNERRQGKGRDDGDDPDLVGTYG
jgi:hypothetical protein